MELNLNSNECCPTCGKLIVRDCGMPDIVNINGKRTDKNINIMLSPSNCFKPFPDLRIFSGDSYHRNCFTCTHCGEINIELAAYKSVKGSSYFYYKTCWGNSNEKAEITTSPRYTELM